MAGNPREHIRDKGFWDGGDAARSENGQSGGRPSGFPGERKPSRTGVNTDLDCPEPDDENSAR